MRVATLAGWMTTSVLLLVLTVLGCPPRLPDSPADASDADTPWTRDGASSADDGVLVEPACASAAHVLHALGCPEGDDERRFGVVCTMGRGGTADLRIECVTKAKTQDDVRGCCGAGEVCSHIRCRATPR